MSISRPPNSDRTEMSGSTIGFRFHANEEQLEEVQSKEDSPDVKEENVYLKLMTDFLKPEVLEGGRVLILNKDTVVDGLKEQRNLLGKRSISVDSSSESPFTNPIERWRKFSDFREKITKTMEGKISEMKIDRNVLGKTKLIHSKENSSISDSEDTSEGSKISEQCKEVENQILTPEKTIVQNSKITSNLLDSALSEVKKETNYNEGDNEMRNRKSFTKFSELLNVTDIKVSVAKKEDEANAVSEEAEDIESGVEADESLSKEGSGSMALLDGDPSVTDGRDSNNPPFDDTFGGALAAVILSQTNTAVFLLLFFLYLFIPLPEFFKGCLLSFLLMIFWGTLKDYMHCEENLDHQVSYTTLDYSSMSHLRVPKTEVPKGVWFNEYEKETYDPDYYSVTNTVPVYIELEGNTLKVSRGKGKIRRRATFDEPEYKLPIISKRVFNLRGCNVYLLPEGLTRKRLFSKKYPIVILLKRDSLISEQRNGKEIEDKDILECFETEVDVSNTTISPKNRCTLFLFARCDRQKEEWYRRLLMATKVYIPYPSEISPRVTELSENENGKSEEERTWSDDNQFKEPSIPFENLHFSEEDAVLDEYFQYMASVANFKNGEEHKEGEEEYRAMQAQIQWFNAFVNRILFDVFRSPYWLAKIQDKVQRKLNSIRMPYYIEDIEVIEMDLGKTGPMFHRVSSPYIDDRGLWFDMDLTFNGLIRLTIQTHLNLVKLQKGAQEIENSASLGTASNPEKLKKGKKSEKSEKDSKTNVANKESAEESLKLSSQITSSEVVTQKEKPAPEAESRTTDEYTEKLIDEVSQLAEIAVEEVISGSKDSTRGSKILAPLQKEEEDSKDCPPCPCPDGSKSRSPIYDSELEDSAESSSEEDEEPEEPHMSSTVTSEEPRTMGKRYPRNRRSSKRIFKVFENVAQSKYFRTMAQSKYIQKAIAGVSAAKLRLTIEIKSCTGILAVNVPPPPSDRFWYGFRKMPTLIFSANPKIGDKAVRFIHIRNYLQKKILYELKKVMVAPNMIDFVLPTSAPARSSSFVQVAEPDMQEETLSD